ncbi:ribonuclease Z [Paenibacillus humicola]|uniref:ribonuclease Z n=1 Tax=Paenibacillus humicola TaxID=3110540 RepID=UPI00237AA359|nr:ribonuclease Z [Paenibacillus humicola]
MRVMFLGTSAGRPTKARNVTSIALLLPERAGAFWLFDAGEGTQHRLLETRLKLNKLERVFITHLHGDHVYGLPGLLSSRSYFEGAGPLQVFGPAGLKAYIEHAFKMTGARLEYELDIRETAPGRLWQDESFAVDAAELQHRLPCFGYRIEEAAKPGRLDTERLARIGLPPGPLYGRLKRGEDVVLPGGEPVRAAEVVGPPMPGRIVTILGDTRPCDNAVVLAKGAHLLVHEATFAAGMEEKAAAYGHSTIAQAAETAAKAGACRLAVTHFSSRFSPEAVDEMVGSVQDVFPNTVPAEDFLELEVGRPE